MGKIKVQSLTPALLDKRMRDFFSAGYSFSTLSGTYTLLRHALDYAVYPAQLISSNPAAYIKVPKKSPRNVIKRTIISRERFNALLEKYPFGTPLYLGTLLIGCRLRGKKITLSRQIVQISGKGYFFLRH